MDIIFENSKTGERDVLPIGKLIRKLRVKRDVKQREIAEAVGVSVSLISQIEIGKKYPSVDTLARVADYFGLSIGFIK